MTADGILFDPLSKQFSDDPYKIYGQLRELEQPYYFEDQNMWLLSRYDDVVNIATNPNMVRSLEGIETKQEALARRKAANWHDMPYHERFVQFSLLDSDGDIHRRLRKLVFGFFLPGSIAHLEPVVRNHVRGLINSFEGREEIEFIEEFASQVPGFVIGYLLGAPKEYSHQLRIWSERVVKFFDVDRSDEKKQIAEEATREFYEFLVELQAQRRKSPKNDLISKMIVDADNGLYTEDEFISTCMLILMAGHGSTIDVLGTGMYTLLKHPKAMDDLRRAPDSLPIAIQEMVRFEPPLPFFHRHALEAVNIRGVEYPAGTTFGLLYGAANRDPNQFSDADQFIYDRTPNRHLAFGHGAHLCLGNHIARQNMRIIFEELLGQYKELYLANENFEFKRGLSSRGMKTLPLDLLRS